jgi:hypothetical protein
MQAVRLTNLPNIEAAMLHSKERSDAAIPTIRDLPSITAPLRSSTIDVTV